MSGEDFLTYLQKKAAQPSLLGAGTPGYASGQALGRANTPFPEFTLPDASATTTPETSTPDAPYSTGVSGILSDVMGAVSHAPGGGLGLGVLDVLSRPSYAMNNALQNAARQDNPIDALRALYDPSKYLGQEWQGLSGKQKVLGADVVDEVSQDLGKDPATLNRPLRGLLGFGIDVGADPTTYVGPGLVKSGIKGLLGGVVKSAPELAAVETKTLEHAASEASLESANKLSEAASAKASAKPWDNFDAPVPKVKEPVPYQNLRDAAQKTLETPAPVVKAVEDTAPSIEKRLLTSAEAPGFKYIPASAKVVEQLAKYDLPIPHGEPIRDTSLGWATPSSTHSYPFPGERSLTSAQDTIDSAKNYLDVVKTSKPSTLINDLKKSYENGDIRPAKDTPAESELMHQIQIQEAMDIAKRGASGGRTSKDVTASPINFHLIDPIDRAFATSGDPAANLAGHWLTARVAGKTVEITSDQLWNVFHNKAATLADGTPVTTAELSIRSRANPNKWVPAKAVAENNAKALNSPRFWSQATAAAKSISNNPKSVASVIMKQQVDFIQSARKTTTNYLEEWRKAAKASSPALSQESLDAAYKAAKDMLDEVYGKMQQGATRMDERAFFNGVQFTQKIKEAMTSAISRNANPEEVVADVATIKHESDILDLQGLAATVQSHIANLETKSALGAKLQEQMDQADAALEAAQKLEEDAPAARMDKAQTTPGDVTKPVRQAANANSLSPSAEEIIKNSDFTESTTLSADKATGLVKSNTAQVTESMSKKQPYFEAAKQAGVVNRILDSLGEGRPALRAILFGRGGTKTAARVTNIIRATERNIEELEGSVPSVWNKAAPKSSGKKGFPVGEPGKVGEATVSGPINHGFSSADLLDNMMRDSARVVAEGAKDPMLAQKALFGLGKGNARAHWTDILHSALFKDPTALGRVAKVDKSLHDWLLNYDPAPDVTKIDAIRTGKLTANVNAQVTSAVEHTAETVVKDSPARAAMNTSKAGNIADKAIQRTPGTPAADKPLVDASAQSAANQTEQALNTLTPVEKSVESSKARLMKAVTGSNIAEANAATRGVTRTAGSKVAKAGQTISDAAFDSPMMRKLGMAFRTNYGAVITRPIMQNSFDGTTQLMAAASREWSGIQDALRQLPNNEGLRVLKALNPEIGPSVLGPEATKLYEDIRRAMESTFGGSGLERHIAGRSSATISALTRGHLNAWIKSKRVLGSDGKFFQLGEGATGEDWLAGWEHAASQFENTDKGIHFLHSLEQSIYAAVTERNFYDDLAVRFGGQGTHFVNNDYLKGIGFHEDLAPQINQIESLVEALKSPKASNKALQVYDQTERLWKTGRTIYSPSHHIRNAIGDTWLMMADGGGIKDINRAAKLMNKYRAANLNLTDHAGASRGISLADAKNVDEVMQKILDPAQGKVSVVNKSSKTKISEEQIMAAGQKYGLFQSAGTIEDIMASSAMFEKVPRILKSPLGGKVHHAVATGAEIREHTIRLAHFTHALETTVIKKPKEMSAAMFAAKKQEMLFEQAAMRVRRWHPDGLDLTNFERKVARRLIPFYSWSRKSTPLILATAIRRPGLITLYPKALQNLSMAGGTDPNNPLNRYLPGDQLFDSFNLNMTGAAFGTSLNSGGRGYQVATGPSTPGNDLITQLNAPKTALQSLVTPAISIPSEMINGTYFGTSIPMDSGAQVKNVAQNIVPGPFAGWVGSKNTPKNNVLNYLLALGLRDTGDPGYQKSAQFAEQANAKAGRP